MDVFYQTSKLVSVFFTNVYRYPKIVCQ